MKYYLGQIFGLYLIQELSTIDLTNLKLSELLFLVSIGVSIIRGVFLCDLCFRNAVNPSLPISPSPTCSCLSLREKNFSLHSFKCISFKFPNPTCESNLSIVSLTASFEVRS